MGFQFNRLSMLVAEDTLPMQKLACAVLETLGFGRVFKAADGQHGFDLFCRENPDIVLCDWHMAPDSGLEMTRNIRRSGYSPNKMAPVIMMTGYSAPRRVTMARDAGVTEFLVKPFRAGDLVRRIAHVIERPRDFIHSSDYFGPDRRRARTDAYAGACRRSGPEELPA